ncbi:MAG: glutamine-hydrolyzing carbamoyl-phosphate synthase small subunit [Methanobacteriota archaeon]|nr:MAG: glutamine-hydrolyzing carbamoyl-phosphate synthase small subunit [Euryarchaeota archaeon]
MKALLALEDGTLLRGEAFGSKTTAFGEIVFNTNMTGYCEALTDPSYKGQILMMTYPLIGNYGVQPETSESDRIQPSAFVVRELCRFPYNVDSKMKVSQFIKSNDIPGISDVDTRMLTIKIRKHGTLKAAVSTDPDRNPDELVEEVISMPHPTETNLVSMVSCQKPRLHDGNNGKRIVLIDCGVKNNIINNCLRIGQVMQVPYDTTAEEILDFEPDGVLVSNGPGDPAHPEIMETTVETVRRLSEEIPLMGICLGHQILSLALGAETYKLKFGHRGGNQPVKNLTTGLAYITSQNHGFAVKPELPEDLEVAEINLNDGTVESIKHKSLPILSVQYHPEASPGPHDANHLFRQFEILMEASHA